LEGRILPPPRIEYGRNATVPIDPEKVIKSTVENNQILSKYSTRRV
uniref:Pseudaminic acid cytidylyltransferase n=1 Tax=Anisakis simplex TaxID=6269 RepID=A0A0M3JJY0_ANISI